jgi:hypothetical protein
MEARDLDIVAAILAQPVIERTPQTPVLTAQAAVNTFLDIRKELEERTKAPPHRVTLPSNAGG